MTESNFKTVSGLPMAVVVIFLLVYGILFVLLQIDVGISMFAGFIIAGIFYVLNYTGLIQTLQKKEDE